MKQATALDILKTGKNVFLTGSAGAGKTYTINQYLHYLRARDVAVAVTASTGIAATHMNGMTIHSWAGIGISNELTAKDIARIKKRTVVVERIERTKVLVIDEISMLHRQQFELINQVLQAIKENTLPFGGIQLLVAGDFFQLPPIGEPHESNRDKFAFMAQAWLDADFQICYLSEQHRQTTDKTAVLGNTYYGLDLNAILNQIRSQQFTPHIMPALTATAEHVLADNRTRLFTHNVNVQAINEQELGKLTTAAHTFRAWGEGDEKLVETLKKSVRNTPELVLKLGAKVMFIKNNSELGVSNGTMGELIGFAAVKIDDSKDTSDDLIEDTALSETKRWVLVAPKGSQEFSLLLAKADGNFQKQNIGNQSGGRVFLFLNTDNFDRDYQNLKDNNIEIVREPKTEDYGKVLVFKDIYGNLWDLIQRNN